MGTGAFTGGKGWSAEKIQRFIKDWNAGLEAFALREKYGSARPYHMAGRLRERGYVLVSRDRWGNAVPQGRSV